MPKALLNLNDFSGGLVNAINPRDIAPNQMSDTDNIILDERSSIRPLGGDVEHTDIPSGTTGNIAAGHGAFIFESDHEKGSTALDTGENWLVMCDAVSSQIDLYDLKGDSFTSNVFDLGTNDAETFGSNKLAFNDNSGSGANDTIVDDDSGFIADGFRKGDIISVSGCTDQAANNMNSVPIKNITASTITINKSGLVTQEANEAGTPTLTKLCKAVYYFADEGLRVADGSFSSGTQPYHYSYIKRTQFQGLSLSSTTAFDNWFANTNGLAAPTQLTTTASYPSAGTGFRITAASAAITGGGYLNQAYQIAATFIYDGNQESLPFIPTSSNTFTPTGDGHKVTFELRATGPFDERITGARIYQKLSGTNDPWALLIDIDLNRGARSELSSEHSAWTLVSGDTVRIQNIVSLVPNLETYEILNGFQPTERKISISGNGEGYKTAVIANRRCFIANVKTEDEDGQTVQMRDRIMYTPVGKFDTFPRSYFIDVVRGDAEEYVKLEEFSDRLLAFKSEKLYIVNISAPAPANWFLEEIKNFSGCVHPNATVKTEFGICWVNKYGIFLYNGSDVTNLLTNRIKESTWQTFFNDATILGYNPRKFYLVILKNCFSDDGDVIIYDFRTRSFVKGAAAFDSDVNRSNMVSDWNGNMVTTYQNALTGDQIWEVATGSWTSYTSGTWGSSDVAYSIKEWSDDMRDVATNNFSITTKDFDFGEPGRMKKIYSVIITYKSDNAQTQPIYYAVDGSDSFSSQLTGNFTANASWAVLRATAATPIECQSIRFKVKNPTSGTGSTAGIQINDISIEYRGIFKRAG